MGLARLRPFPAAEVLTQGWIADQMREDLVSGFVGHLDRLAPDLLVDDDIYGRDRLTAAVDAKDLGALSDDAEWNQQFLWWNSETQSNWRDGWLRHAYLVGDEDHREAARTYVEAILATQDDEGYLGIYAPDLRFAEAGENGELWAQATLLRALLGYHGHTGDARVLVAVRRAVERTMAGYPAPAAQGAGSRPFGSEPSYAGVAHGLAFTDVLWELAHLTGDARFGAYARWLYEEYGTAPVSETDVQPDALLDPARGFAGHGVHTYEHWRALTIAGAAAEGDAEAAFRYQRLQAAYQAKLERALTPSGGPNGDEFCHREGSAGQTGYEYCSIQELPHSYGLLVEATGDPTWADRMESLVFNVGLGARDPNEGGVAYLKTDDSLSMLGAEGFRPPGSEIAQTRYMYSPVHREAAVCCVPNAGRLLPTYLRYQWLRGVRDGGPQIVALLFGASTVNTTVDGVPVTITQRGDYPGGLDLAFALEVDGEADFTWSIRRPAWAWDLDIIGVDAARITATGGLVHVCGPWRGAREVTVRLHAEPEVRTAAGEALAAWGPLLFAQPIPGRREVVRTHPAGPDGTAFRDVLVDRVEDPVAIQPDRLGSLTPAPHRRPAPRPLPPGTPGSAGACRSPPRTAVGGRPSSRWAPPCFGASPSARASPALPYADWSWLPAAGRDEAAMKRAVGRFVVRALRFRIEGGPPPAEPVCVLVGAPHTSWLDFPLMLGIAWANGLSPHFLGQEGDVPRTVRRQ